MCAICGRGKLNSPNLKYNIVCFNETKEEEEYRKKNEKDNFPGQPSNEVWFCEDHIREAVKLKDKTAKEALDLLRKK